MCRFKSGIILKNRVELAPIYNESHSYLLKKLNIKDTETNAMRVFVRAELVPPCNDKTKDLSTWRFVVDQDVVPDWFAEDKERYEKEFRTTVEEWVKKNIFIICGKACVKMKEEGNKTYHMLMDVLFESEFGENNNYAESYIRRKLQNCDFAKELKDVYRDKLVPITLDLFSMDGFDDYGKIEGDVLALRTFDLNRECRRNIPNADMSEFLSTPNSTPTGCGSDYVQYVISNGRVNYNWYNGCNGVRPFFILQS